MVFFHIDGRVKWRQERKELLLYNAYKRDAWLQYVSHCMEEQAQTTTIITNYESLTLALRFKAHNDCNPHS